MLRPMKKPISLAERWLWLGVISLAIAGIYSLIPVVARTPQLKGLGIVQQLFDVALVVHVDLSVLLWFLSMLGMGIAQMMEPHATKWPYWRPAAFAMASLTTALIALCPLDPHWEVIKSNYIPVLHNGMFLLALGVLFSGLLLLVLPVIITHASSKCLKALPLPEWGWLTGALIVLLALGAFFLTANNLPAGQPLLEHYEALFWAGGHIMQFAFTVIAMVAWLSLVTLLGRTLPRRGVLTAYLLALFGAAVSFVGLLKHTADATDLTYFETIVMQELGGVGASLMALLVILALFRRGEGPRLPRNAYSSTLIVSLILFFAGGGLGLMIAGQNVTIPAHYHGMIVGITLALMGLAYGMLPRFGYPSVADTKLAFYQPFVYGAGQLMHIGGLAYCGGYGVLRKTAGGFEKLAPDVKIALGIFGLGGMLAIIGGLLFVVVMAKVWLKRPSV